MRKLAALGCLWAVAAKVPLRPPAHGQRRQSPHSVHQSRRRGPRRRGPAARVGNAENHGTAQPLRPPVSLVDDTVCAAIPCTRLRQSKTATAIKYGDTVVKRSREKQDMREFNLIEREVCVLKLLRQTVYRPSKPVHFKPGWPISTMFTRCASLRDRENSQDAAETVLSLSVDFHTVSASLGPPDCWGRRTQILQ